jgi:flagellar biosynthetic protein FlhB
MSDDSEQNRSEKPTIYRLQKAREKGSVARGVDLGFLAVLIGFTGCLWFEGASIAQQVDEVARQALISAPQVIGDPDQILHVTGVVLTSIVRPFLLAGAALFVIVLLIDLVQTGPVFSTEPLAPNFGRLNPVNGFKRLFTPRLLVETLKNVLKMAIYAGIAALVIRHVQAQVAGTITDATLLAAQMRQWALRLLVYGLAAAALFALLDQLIVRRDFLKKMRMSRREVRREARDREGEPRMKRRRKQLHGELVKLSKSLRGIKGADVLITNPTHYAVALRYDRKTMTAPMIVSQGSHLFAQRLKRLAFIYGVTIVPSPPLARALHTLPLNAQVPEKYFKAVADVYLSLRARKAEAERKSRHV